MLVNSTIAFVEHTTARMSALDHRAASALLDHVAELRALGSFHGRPHERGELLGRRIRGGATVLARRQIVLDTAYQAHPDRFVRRPPKPMRLASEVWINKPAPSGQNTEEGSH